MKVTLLREFSFEAAHQNGAAQAGSRTARLHGHSYGVTVQVSGEVDPHLGWLIDYADLKAECRPVIMQLDHQILNDIGGLTDTSCSDITRWLDERLSKCLPGYSGCCVQILGATDLDPVVESLDGAVDRIGFGFSAAHALPNLPDTHKCWRMHGHSFHVEMTTVQAPALIARLEALYSKLDHQNLNELPGLENPTSEHLARWLWKQINENAAIANEVLVRETCQNGCIYRGEE